MKNNKRTAETYNCATERNGKCCKTEGKYPETLDELEQRRKWSKFERMMKTTECLVR